MVAVVLGLQLECHFGLVDFARGEIADSWRLANKVRTHVWCVLAISFPPAVNGLESRLGLLTFTECKVLHRAVRELNVASEVFWANSSVLTAFHGSLNEHVVVL
jgi:hypothetical protein